VEFGGGGGIGIYGTLPEDVGTCSIPIFSNLGPPSTIPGATCAEATAAAAARFALSCVPNAHAGGGLAEGG